MIKLEGKLGVKWGGKLALGTSVLVIVGWTGVSHGQVISWEEDVYGTVPSNGYAGVVSVDNWTDSYPANQTTNLPDNTVLPPRSICRKFRPKASLGRFSLPTPVRTPTGPTTRKCSTAT